MFDINLQRKLHDLIKSHDMEKNNTNVHQLNQIAFHFTMQRIHTTLMKHVLKYKRNIPTKPINYFAAQNGSFKLFNIMKSAACY